MKVLSLFSGVGGFDLGLEAAGMETVFQCEYDKHCLSVLERHWPDVPRWGDVSTLTGAYILKHAPIIDVVAWGSPCQDLSQAGKRKGLQLAGGRSNLFHEGIRIIKELRELTNGQYPRISIWENVVGALTSNRGADFGVILDEMAKAGALAIEWSVLDAQYFGIPQRRRRVFVLAAFTSAIANNCPNPILPVSESLPRHITKGKQKRKSAAGTLTEGTRTDGGIVNSIGASIYHKSTVVNQDINAGHMVVETNPTRLLGSQIIGSLNATDYKWPQNQQLDENKFIVEPMLIDGTRVDDVRVYEPPVQTLKERMGTGGNNVPLVAYNKTIQYDGYNQTINTTDILLPLRTNRDSSDFITQPTETTMSVRRLTPLECERLMGWEDDHTRYKADGTEQTDTHRYKQCGNGVASPVAQWIGKQIINL